MISTEALAEAVHRLRTAGCVFAEDEAEVLRKAAEERAGGTNDKAARQGTGETQRPQRTQGTQGADDDATLRALVSRRVTGEPLEQVVGWADFGGVRVRLSPGVFVPRVRSELLVNLAAKEAGSGCVVVDLCCGSGALGLALRHRRPDVTLYAADLDSRAVECARLNLNGGVFQGDLFEALPDDLRGRVGLLLANVPYVATRHIPFLPAEARDHEPHAALDGGDDGLAVFRRVVAGAPHWLARGGVLLSEITEAQTAPAVAAATGHGLTTTVLTEDDLDARAISARFH
ncbi:MAG TPA: putative protein N(5)-glutamine methyltransferase [Actinoplanes sp.]|nr:putative protein N(5)-glutamine methyltransferase [Actinoplanes sp.]